MHNVRPGELIVVYVLSMSLSAWVAASKGLSARRFGLIGLVAPVVGMLVALAWPPCDRVPR